MAYAVSVILTLAFQLLAPFVLVAWLARALAPPATYSWATGLYGAFAGAACFALVFFVKTVVVSAGVEALWGQGTEGAALVTRAIGDAALAALPEEVIRFAAALVLFRRAGSKSPLAAAALFGLGWGGLECLYGGWLSWKQMIPIQENVTILPFLPLLAAWERASALVLQVALTAFAARAGMDARERAWGKVAAAFLGALAIHFALDWLVVWYAVPGRRALAADDFTRGLRWLLTMECWFAAGAIGTLSLASRLSSPLAAARAPSP